MAVGKNLFARLGVSGRGRRENVTIYITASRERGEQRLVDLRDQRAQTRLDDAVELDALAGGDAERGVAVARGEVVKHAPLLRGHDAAGDAPTDHHDVFLAGLAEVTVVLLIRAVELQELPVVLGKMIRALVREGRGDGAREGRDRDFNFFVVRQLRRRVGFSHK